MHTDSFPAHYKSLLGGALDQGLTETNERTATKVKVIPGGTSFKLNLRAGHIPIAGNRAYFPHIAAAEVAWQFMGTQDPDFILCHAPKLWSKFVEDGKLKAAYGYRWQKHFQRNQLTLAISQLRSNPTNRQLFISAWDPATDGLGSPGQPKNIPCPVGFSLTTTDKVLHMSVFIRSSDLFVGLPYDVMAYALTLDAIAAEVDMIPGSLHFTLAHAHLYKPHWDLTKACLKDCTREGKSRGASTSWVTMKPNLPAWPISDILENPDGYVKAVKRFASRCTNNSWNPMPEVIE